MLEGFVWGLAVLAACCLAAWAVLEWKVRR